MMILLFRKCQTKRSSFCNERSSFCKWYVEMYTSWYAKRRLLKLVILCGEVFFLHNMDWWVDVVKKGGCASTVKMVTKRRPKMWAKGLLFALSYVEMYQTHAVALDTVIVAVDSSCFVDVFSMFVCFNWAVGCWENFDWNDSLVLGSSGFLCWCSFFNSNFVCVVLTMWWCERKVSCTKSKVSAQRASLLVQVCEQGAWMSAQRAKCVNKEHFC